MRYQRMPIEIESPEEMGYESIRFNLSESSYTDALLGDLSLDISKLVLCYGDHKGLPGLRDLLAQEAAGLDQEQVLVTVGAAAALFIVATALLEAGDELVVVRPNYATNIETPRAIGANIHYLDLDFEHGFQLDVAAVTAAMSPKTRYVSITHPHNPTGSTIPLATLEALVTLCEQYDCYLLVDETYRDMVFGEKTPLAASLSSRVITVGSLSKSYGLPGIRIGWIIASDPVLSEKFLAAKEQIYICGSVVDEYIAFNYLLHRDKRWPSIQLDIRKKFTAVADWMHRHPLLEWVEPGGGVVCFPRMIDPKRHDIDAFYRILLDDYSTYVGPGHWFEMPRHYFRLGYGWPDMAELVGGLQNIDLALRDSLR